MASGIPAPYRVEYGPPPEASSRTNPFLKRYNLMHAKPMEVIHHLYYRLCVENMPGHYKLEEMRGWTGGPKARVPGQDNSLYRNSARQRVSVDPPPDPPLELKHILEVMEWLFTEIPLHEGRRIRNSIRIQKLRPEDQPRYLNRLQCVNAQAVAVGHKNTKHRPYDMLAAIFLCADFMAATDKERDELKGFQKTFMQMYLEQSTHFDYAAKDVFWHDHVARGITFSYGAH